VNLSPLQSLAATWRSEAELLRRRGLGEGAGLMESVAEDLESRLKEWELEALTLEDAADESGYSYSTLQQRVSKGEIPNAGGKGSPKVRRCDLPMKGSRRNLVAVDSDVDIADEVLAARLGGR